jgi:hypothetical protein
MKDWEDLCNYCVLKRLKKEAKNTNQRLTFYEGGYYIHLRMIDITTCNMETRLKYFRTMFLEMTDHCECNQQLQKGETR